MTGRVPAGYQPTLRQALADAIMFRQARAAEDDSDQIGLYRTVARALGLPLPADLPAAGARVTARHGHALAAVHAALEDLHRERRQELLMTDEFASELLEQVVAIEEVLAARWPRSAVLRARLRRDLRASVRHADGRGFRVRRTEAIATGWMTRPGTRLARREGRRAS